MFDLEEHLKRQMAFSRATFGPGERRAGVIDHIRKELDEVAAAAGPIEAAKEWTDVVILALDGLTRALQCVNPHGAGFDPRRYRAAPAEACHRITYKQAENELRVWPDWRTADPDRAIEHVREGV